MSNTQRDWRLLIGFLVAASLAVYMSFDARRWQHRAERAERQLGAQAAVSLPVKASAPLRSFHASNGVILGPADLERVDANDRAIDRVGAELEYSLNKEAARLERPRRRKP